jgi:hypothetical protein
MSSCERCWRIARIRSHDGGIDHLDAYREELAINQCTPEQQAGPDAERYPVCRRMTLHQYTREAMCHCYAQGWLRWPHDESGREVCDA